MNGVDTRKGATQSSMDFPILPGPGHHLEHGDHSSWNPRVTEDIYPFLYSFCFFLLFFIFISETAQVVQNSRSLCINFPSDRRQVRMSLLLSSSFLSDRNPSRIRERKSKVQRGNIDYCSRDLWLIVCSVTDQLGKVIFDK